ncbi:Bro-N domain-containing protein [Erwinia aphidicola]|uniref:BRO-N domain-containing protein n=1 Tax=Erwinia aphidicola TaxID=68334 RepID=UPI003AB5AFB5
MASDVCEALALHTSQIRKLDNEEKGLYSMQPPGGIHEVSLISESGLYFLTISCRDAVKPGTFPHRFRKGVTNEVLP